MYTVLLVDDINMFLEIQKEYLQESQVKILTARDGLEALEVIRARRPDLVFMDVQMPNMDGMTCCRTVKSDSDCSNIPIVLISSSKTESDIERCYSSQCDFFISKPYGRDLFLEVARKFLYGINRRNKRMPCKIEAYVHINDDIVPCTMHDLSIGGSFVATDYQTAPGYVVKISFNLPDGEKIDCQGRIAWVSGNGMGRQRGFGIKFALMPKASAGALCKTIYGGS